MIDLRDPKLKEQIAADSINADYIAICMFNILAMVDDDKDYYIGLGFGQSPLSVSAIAGNVLKSLAQEGNMVAQTGKVL